MRIQHNIAAMNSYRNYSGNTKAVAKNLEKLSSGYKINRAGDDAAGLAISEKMRAQITGLETASKNAKDGISLVQTAEGALTEVHSMLNRMFELSEQSANGTYDNTVDRANLQKEVTALKTEIDRVADSSNFNGIKLLNGTLGKRTTTAVTATANGIKDITFLGGGTGATGSGSVTAPDLDFQTTAAGLVSLTDTTAVTGITWSLVGGTGADNVGANGNKSGGSVTWIASAGATATKADADFYNGMTVTVTLDAANASGAYVPSGTAPNIASISGSNGLTLQIGDTAAAYDQMTVSVGDMHTTALNINSVNVGDQASAKTAMQSIKTAINSVSSTRGDLGALQNRLDHTINNLGVMQENIQDAESTIRDVDVAKEMMAYTKNNILVQSAQAMLAQANQLPQGVLQLLQ